MSSFSHLDADGRPRMVDVAEKPATRRRAVARTAVRMSPEALAAVRDGTVAKGDVLTTAQVAGVMGAKRTADWIPMCHPLPLAGVELQFRCDEVGCRVEIEARVQAVAPTGVEMEALTAATAAALTLYDMVKAIDPAMVIGPTWLVSKEGGRRGPFRQFRSFVAAVAGAAGPLPVLALERQQQLQLLPEGREPQPDAPAAWLTATDMDALVPGACLEAGPLRLEVLYARADGWLAEVNDPGVLRAGDWLEAAR